MKNKTLETIMTVFGWITLVLLIISLPMQFLNNYIFNIDTEAKVMVMYVVVVVLEMLLAIALIRKKKDALFIVAIGGEVLRKLVVILMNLSMTTVFSVIDLLVYVFMLFVVLVNCVPKLSANKLKINKVWFLPVLFILVITVTSFVKTMINYATVGFSLPTVILSITNLFSSIFGILPYFLMFFWFYKTQEE